MVQHSYQDVWCQEILRVVQPLKGENEHKNTLSAEKAEDVFDELYRRFDFETSPFGYDIPYITWRKTKINEEIVLYVKGGKILDDGGGYGFLHRFLNDPRYDYYNLDCSLEMLKYDTSRHRILGEGERLPFKDESFDIVVSGDVLEHTIDRIRYLQEAHRVLKKGGIFILNTPRTGWKKSYMRSIFLWIPLLSDFYSRMKISSSSRAVPPNVPDMPSDETWLAAQLEGLGYDIILQSRTDNHLFVFTHAFWRKFADLFISPTKYGHCAFFVCQKK
ncbi:MAG: class I SAM-dependent methyltransferase [Theionarchaea archaeon]|nr:class I SAM-dependent methyltransferase [Theionarchaea archaeon]